MFSSWCLFYACVFCPLLGRIVVRQRGGAVDLVCNIISTGPRHLILRRTGIPTDRGGSVSIQGYEYLAKAPPKAGKIKNQETPALPWQHLLSTGQHVIKGLLVKIAINEIAISAESESPLAGEKSNPDHQYTAPEHQVMWYFVVDVSTIWRLDIL